MSRWLAVAALALAACAPPQAPDAPAPPTAASPEHDRRDEASSDEAGSDEAGSAEGSAEVAAVDEAPVPAAPVVPPAPEGGAHVDCGDAPDGMVCIAGGWFTRGLDDDPHRCGQADQPRDGRSSITPAARVWVDTFYLDRHEVTNAQYQACVEAGDCSPGGPLYRDYDAPEQPITGITWFQARDYCAAHGRRLPTDAEFERASQGPNGEAHPWGDAPATCETAIIQDESGRACGRQKRGSSPDTGRIWEVCSRPEAPNGTCDLLGNAEEWVADWWSEDWASCGEACARPNPRGPCDGAERCPGHRYKSIRGGSWYWPAEHATAWHRRRYEPDNDPPHHFGFRCAVSIPDGTADGSARGAPPADEGA